MSKVEKKDFQTTFDLETRKQKVQIYKNKHSDTIPIVVEQLQSQDNTQQFKIILINDKLKVSDLILILHQERKNNQAQNEDKLKQENLKNFQQAADFLYLYANKKSLLMQEQKLSDVYAKYINKEDGFLYIYTSTIQTYG